MTEQREGEPMKPKERLALQGLQREWEASDEFYYDEWEREKLERMLDDTADELNAVADERRKLFVTARELESFRGDVLAGCDISRGDRLYRQVEVVIGPGKTRDQLECERLRAELDDAHKQLASLHLTVYRLKRTNYEQADRIYKLEEQLDNYIEGEDTNV